MPRKFKIIILFLTTLAGGGWVYQYTLDTTVPYVAEFHVKECFQFFNSHGKKADGYITSISETEYTVMWTPEAARRSAAVKMGYRVPMKWLDQYASRVTCPWQSTKGGAK